MDRWAPRRESRSRSPRRRSPERRHHRRRSFSRSPSRNRRGAADWQQTQIAADSGRCYRERRDQHQEQRHYPRFSHSASRSKRQGRSNWDRESSSLRRDWRSRSRSPRSVERGRSRVPKWDSKRQCSPSRHGHSPSPPLRQTVAYVRQRGPVPRHSSSSMRGRSPAPRTPSPKERSPTPQRRSPTPERRSYSTRREAYPVRKRSSSPQHRYPRSQRKYDPSPKERAPSPRQRSPSPLRRSRSPYGRSASQHKYHSSAYQHSRSPRQRSRSPRPRSSSSYHRSSSPRPGTYRDNREYRDNRNQGRDWKYERKWKRSHSRSTSRWQRARSSSSGSSSGGSSEEKPAATKTSPLGEPRTTADAPGKPEMKRLAEDQHGDRPQSATALVPMKEAAMIHQTTPGDSSANHKNLPDKVVTQEIPPFHVKNHPYQDDHAPIFPPTVHESSTPQKPPDRLSNSSPHSTGSNPAHRVPVNPVLEKKREARFEAHRAYLKSNSDYNRADMKCITLEAELRLAEFWLGVMTKNLEDVGKRIEVHDWNFQKETGLEDNAI